MIDTKVLVADDDPIIRKVLGDILKKMFLDVKYAETAAETLDKSAKEFFDLVLLDLRFPDSSDLSTLEALRQRTPNTDVILVTAEVDNLGLVTEATRLGAFDYVPKPLREDDILIRVTRVLEMRALRRSSERMINEVARGKELNNILGNSMAMSNIRDKICNFANYEIPVLIEGETGTGKELVARALHNAGIRRGRPFIAVNCAALPETLTESELFGHERGAFTGANSVRKGAFEEAEDGTLFLDEIGDMSPQAQASLLRVLENNVYRSVGGREKKVSARVVFATNQDLNALSNQAQFRQDLLYRINRAHIQMPALRERRDDIPLLAHYFLKEFDDKTGKGISSINANVISGFVSFDWPGNVRQLRNEIERAYISSTSSELKMLDFSTEIFITRNTNADQSVLNTKSLDEIHKVIEALRSTGGNVSQAAKILGVHRNTIHRWMKKYELER